MAAIAQQAAEFDHQRASWATTQQQLEEKLHDATTQLNTIQHTPSRKQHDGDDNDAAQQRHGGDRVHKQNTNQGKRKGNKTAKTDTKQDQKQHDDSQPNNNNKKADEELGQKDEEIKKLRAQVATLQAAAAAQDKEVAELAASLEERLTEATTQRDAAVQECGVAEEKRRAAEEKKRAAEEALKEVNVLLNQSVAERYVFGVVSVGGRTCGGGGGAVSVGLWWGLSVWGCGVQHTNCIPYKYKPAHTLFNAHHILTFTRTSLHITHSQSSTHTHASTPPPPHSTRMAEELSAFEPQLQHSRDQMQQLGATVERQKREAADLLMQLAHVKEQQQLMQQVRGGRGGCLLGREVGGVCVCFQHAKQCMHCICMQPILFTHIPCTTCIHHTLYIPHHTYHHQCQDATHQDQRERDALQARLDTLREELVTAHQAMHDAQATAAQAEQRVQQAEEQARVARLERDQAITQAQVMMGGDWADWCGVSGVGCVVGGMIHMMISGYDKIRL